MKTRILIIFVGIIMSLSVLTTDYFETKYVYAACAAPLFWPKNLT